MNTIIYGRDEITAMLSGWATILESWDDNKSHKIDSQYFQSMRQSARQLMDYSDEIHSMIIALAREVDSI